MHTLSDLPYDVIQLIASFVLPYDVLALSSACRALRSIKDERGVWLQVADSVSRSRPLPFMAVHVAHFPLKVLMKACLRAERIAKNWAKPHIYTRREPVRIVFPDRRIVTYFGFLPGSNHIMIYDSHNVLSCWTTDGLHLASLAVGEGAVLSRWKPCDEEKSYDFHQWGTTAHGVEITVEYSAPSQPTLCRLILLVYTLVDAGFEAVSEFQVPPPFEPFSTFTQDEIRGELVRLNTVPEKVGIFLTTNSTGKSICIDTGLRLSIQHVPQALLSSTHIVLYWEHVSSAHAYAYQMDHLLDLLEREGCEDGDPMVRFPKELPPSEVVSVPFRTVNTPSCRGCGAHINHRPPGAELPSEICPIIIPKWRTFREDLRRNRTRSVLSFSRLPPTAAQLQPQALAVYFNPPHYNTLRMHLVGGDDEHRHRPGGGCECTPRTTIAHHYFDLNASLSSNAPQEIVRTVLADAPLRGLQSLRVHRRHANLFDANYWDPEVNTEPEGRHLASGGNATDQHATETAGNEGAPQEEHNEHDDLDTIVRGLQALTLDHNEPAGAVDTAADPIAGPVAGPSNDHHPAVPVWGLSPSTTRALVGILQDPFGGSPVIGFGGRCAMWVEEHAAGHNHGPGPSGRRCEAEPVLRVATFPAYEPSERDKAFAGPVHRELEASRASVGTFHLPAYIPLESSYAFDLDDVSGLVGMATLFGDLWVVDFA